MAAASIGAGRPETESPRRRRRRRRRPSLGALLLMALSPPVAAAAAAVQRILPRRAPGAAAFLGAASVGGGRGTPAAAAAAAAIRSPHAAAERRRSSRPSRAGRGGAIATSSSLCGTARPRRPHPSETATATEAATAKKGKGRRGPRPRKSDPTSDTGGLRRLPVVKPPDELLNRARREARSTPADSAMKNARNRARKHGAETMQAVTKALCVPLRDVVRGYERELRRLHPFERVVADLTARAREKRDGLTLMDVLDELNEARKELLLAGKDWTAKAKSAQTAREASEAMREGEERMYELFGELAADPLRGVLDLQKSLRSAPAVRLDTPAVVLVGSPNVGKSSIVRAISSGTPEVNNYPFTTRGMTLGHVEVFWEDDSTAAAAVIPLGDDDGRGEGDGGRKLGEFERSVEMERVMGRYSFSQLCQIMDSPGLLVRPDDERNEMEALTMAAMSHLPTAVMYVMDLSGGAGDRLSSVEDQLQLRREMRVRFPRRPWIDVVSKADLGMVDKAREKLEEVLDGAQYLEVSVKEQTGIDDLRGEVMRMLEEVRVVLDAMAAVDGRTARSTS